MDTPTNTSQPTAPESPATPSIDTGINNGSSGEEFANDEQSGIGEALRSIPWGKILMGAIVLFLVIWGLIYLLSGNKSTPVTTTPIAIEENKKTIAVEQAQTVGAQLGQNQYNAILQPNFSLDGSTPITATEPRVALLQSAGVLEQTLNFDLFAHLATESDKNAALQQYETKLGQSLNSTQQWLAMAANRLTELATAINGNVQQQAQLLRQVNASLVTDPTSSAVPSEYAQFVEVTNQIALLNTEQTLLTQIIRQVNPLLSRATVREQNITVNRDALIQGIRVVDLDDPGLKLVVETN